MRPAAVGLGAAVLAAAGLATLCGADAARRHFDPAHLAESGLARTLATHDPEPAREARELLEKRLRRNPLDTASRTIAASLLVETATTEAQREAAVAQAEAAVRLTPVDASVAHRAARVLARCGRTDLALQETARLFEYAPQSAASTLADIEPFVAVDRLDDALPPSPRPGSPGRAGFAPTVATRRPIRALRRFSRGGPAISKPFASPLPSQPGAIAPTRSSASSRRRLRFLRP